MAKTEWIALSYSVPTSPSKIRVFVWRRLRAIEAQALRPGMAILPNTGKNLAAFESLAEKIREFGGDATLIEMNFVSHSENADMRLRFSQARADSLKETIGECDELVDKFEHSDSAEVRSSIKKELRRKLKKVIAPPSSITPADEMEQAAEDIFDALKGLKAELSSLLRANRRSS